MDGRRPPMLGVTYSQQVRGEAGYAESTMAPTRGGSSSSSSSNNNNNRIALSLIATVLGLYLFGLVGTAWHLPTIDRGRRSWLRRLRGKLGVATPAGDGSSTNRAVANVVSGDVRLLAAGTDIDLSKNGISDPPPPPEAADTDDDESAEDDEVELPANNNTRYENLEDASDGESPIPRSKWPISIRDDEGNFENVIHPGHRAMGHPDVIMSVPRFWINNPVSVHRMTLMPRELAMQIGSCVTPDPLTGDHARGDDCPVNERTIYVAIASYRDWQCRDTVTSIFSRATHPNRVRVAVTDQIVEGEDGKCNAPYKPCTDDPTQALCIHKNQLDVFQMDAQLSIGPVFARHFGHRMYRGEYYAMQSDAHVTFTKGWDVDIVKQQESTGNEMAVLSTYLTDIDGSIDSNGNSVRNTRPIMCNTDYEEGQKNRYLRHGSQPESEPEIEGMPQLQPYWAAGFSFSRGHFVVNVPYDFYQPMIFQGEEMSIGIRGFTIGYDFYAPERSVCFHHYAGGKNKRGRDKVRRRRNSAKTIFRFAGATI